MLLSISLLSPSCPAESFTVVIPQGSDTRIRFAAGELSSLLRDMYEQDVFPVQAGVPDTGDYVLLGTRSGFPEMQALVTASEVVAPGSFVVKHLAQGDRNLGVICGADSRGARDGVYALLGGKLGYGFYLTRNAKENADTGAFSFDKWSLAAHPSVQERITFNWDNFISGSTAWNYPEWRNWILQSARMRYTGVMVHFYGWGPATQFDFNGKTKAVEYLQNTKYGSEWGVVHTPDVRTLLGGELFDGEGPIFGADAGKIGFNGVTLENRADKVKALMKSVSTFAKDTAGMDFIFATDVDIKEANDQVQIKTLAESDRFQEISTGYWLARPDTKAGYEFYKAQARMLTETYPGMSTYDLWFRAGKGRNSVSNELDYAELPAPWRSEYDAAPAGAKTWGAPMLFAAKVAKAYRQAFDELGHSDIKLGYGSWWWDNDIYQLFDAADFFFDTKLTAYPLDYNMVFGSSASYRARLKATGLHRKLILIEWAQHDDGKYLGRPFTPPASFNNKLLMDANASGFGVIHWMTRPLDIFFKSLENQVWSSSMDESLSVTCRAAALDWFGPKASQAIAAYLEDWMATAPQFNCETCKSIAFNVTDVDSRVAECKRRIAMLDQVDKESLSPAALKRWKFFRGNEEWISLFHQADASGSLAAQKNAIRKYAETIDADGATRGELGILIQQNLKWIHGTGAGMRETPPVPLHPESRPAQANIGIESIGGDLRIDLTNRVPYEVRIFSATGILTRSFQGMGPARIKWKPMAPGIYAIAAVSGEEKSAKRIVLW